MATKLPKCQDGKRHVWNWRFNKTYTTQSFHTAHISSKGIYKCAVCGASKLGCPR